MLGRALFTEMAGNCKGCTVSSLFKDESQGAKLTRNSRYEDIQLVGADSIMQRKRYKLNVGTRLILLRRTLRSNPQIASLVRSLKVPSPPPEAPLSRYQEFVATVIMACPNLERLSGFHQQYDHSFNRFFHALSTREHLKDMTWVIGQPAPQNRRPDAKSSSRSAGKLISGSNTDEQAVPDDLDPDQSAMFLDMHANWSQLTTLTIHCLPGGTLTPVSLLGTMMAHLPALEDLHLSHLPPTSFNDSNLLSLPPLRTLSLSDMSGISEAGLAAFARRPSSQSIKSLTLRHINVRSLPVVGRIFSYLTSLESFTLVQAETPMMPDGEMIWLFPYLASRSLRKLHWDVTTPATRASPSDAILARSIGADGFPSLRSLRTPNDADGLFQSLCKPTDRIEVATDRYKGLISRAANANNGTTKPSSDPPTPITPQGSLSSAGSVSISGGVGGPGQSPRGSNLALARLAAQARLEAAWSNPRFHVDVVDEDGSPVQSFGLGGFIGDAASRIRYLVTADEGARDESGGLVEVADLLADGGESIGPTAAEEQRGRKGSYSSSRSKGRDRVNSDEDERKEGCSGRWNASDIGDKRDRERWWHTERGRWRDVRLS